jgi:pimeloyl-ACP methyl ester carboxylesterase
MWGSNGPNIQNAYDALVQKICPCVIVVHSQGGNFGFNMVRNAPDKVKALVALEPSGSPDPTKVDLTPVKNVPTLVVWGDFMEGYERWMEIRTNVAKYEEALRKAGAVVEHVDLPTTGIKGNSHMMMMDRNSDQVAGVVQKWFEKQGLMK